MLPHLTMNAGYSPSFPDRASLSQRARCAGGKEHHIDPRTGNALCHCHFPFGAPSFSLSPAHNAEGRTGHNSPNHSQVAIHLPPYDEAESIRKYIELTSKAKDHMTSRSIPIGGPYTPAALAAYHPYLYTGYEQGGIRKAAVRETTGPLKAWLHEHKKNPYPTKAEKVMLAIITQMTLTQVSTWFANARRRLKKETRGGWDGSSDHDDDKDSNGQPGGKDTDSTNADHYDNFSDVSVDDDDDDMENNVAGSSNDSPSSAESPPICRIPYPIHSFPPHHPFLTSPLPLHAASLPLRPEVTSENARSPGNGGSVGNRTNKVAAAAAAPKPRIWSISAIIGLDEKDSVAEKEEKSSCSSSSGDKNVDSAAYVSAESDSTDSGVADSELVCSTSNNHGSPVSPNTP